MPLKETLTIGEMASLFHMNVQTLRYYDSIRLFRPRDRNDQTNYRYYEFDQIYHLANIRYLRKMGYSIQQIEEYMDTRDIHYTLDWLKIQSEKLHKQWEELMRIDMAIQRKIDFIEQELPNIDLTGVKVRNFPDRYYMPIGSEEMLYREDSFYLYPTIVFYHGDLKLFGTYLFQEEKKEGRNAVGHDQSLKQASCIPGGRFVCGYHQGPYTEIPETIARIAQAIPELTLSEWNINFNIIDQFVERDSRKYVTEIQIPITEAGEDAFEIPEKFIH